MRTSKGLPRLCRQCGTLTIDPQCPTPTCGSGTEIARRFAFTDGIEYLDMFAFDAKGAHKIYDAYLDEFGTFDVSSEFDEDLEALRALPDKIAKVVERLEAERERHVRWLGDPQPVEISSYEVERDQMPPPECLWVWSSHCHGFCCFGLNSPEEPAVAEAVAAAGFRAVESTLSQVFDLENGLNQLNEALDAILATPQTGHLRPK